MDFSLSATQTEFKERILRFARARLAPTARELDGKGAFDRDSWAACGEEGIQGLPVPRQYGGQGEDAFHTVLALEALGYVCANAGFLFALNAHMWAVEMPLVRFGTEDQKEIWLPGLCDGSVIGAFASVEPGSGSDTFSMSTTAVRRDGGYVLRGAKTYSTNAPNADVLIVFARVPGTSGGTGISAFLVPSDTPGLTVRSIDAMGLRSANMGEVTLDDCFVVEDARLGPEGAGVAVFTEAMTWERSFILAMAVGAMQRQLEQSASFLKQRRQELPEGAGVRDHGGKLVDMHMRVECGRLLLYKTAWLKGLGQPILLESSMTKLFISEAWVASSLDAIQLRGGHGYLTESDVERDLRDAMGSKIFSGTSEIQRMIIGQEIGA